jgi:hypothetical protein
VEEGIGEATPNNKKIQYQTTPNQPKQKNKQVIKFTIDKVSLILSQKCTIPNNLMNLPNPNTNATKKEKMAKLIKRSSLEQR